MTKKVKGNLLAHITNNYKDSSGSGDFNDVTRCSPCPAIHDSLFYVGFIQNSNLTVTTESYDLSPNSKPCSSL